MLAGSTLIMDDAAALAVTLARAQQLLQRPLSPTVAESSVDALTNQLQSITSGRHRRGKRVLSGSRSAAGLRPPRDIRCVDGELHNHEEAYHNALDTLDEITREMKEKMKSTMRRGKHGGRKAHRSEGYDEARIAQMRTNIAKLEEQLEVEKGLLQPRADQKGADAARARLKAWYERERHDTIKPAGTGVEGDPGQEERKILRLQRRVARTLRTVARERRARMQHEAIEAEESRRRKAVNDERATREQHAAAERVAERVRQAREEDAARRKAEERQARARLAADRTRVDQLRRRTRERMKKMSTLERREAPDHYTIIGNEGVEKARRLAARRAKQTHQRIMREQQAAAARQAHELSLRRREMEETVKRYR
ncbi:hypothetical protein FOZ61_006345 [Perkinsus olseni]|uniref:Uncharacterized protein n=1 Tax=Perkinsus olseni TaxID=32597 RepID=A0A7J6MAD7_PEROL|nr:hypothetical protein FOZ61_006345 [Perkinsus olseni]